MECRNRRRMSTQSFVENVKMAASYYAVINVHRLIISNVSNHLYWKYLTENGTVLAARYVCPC